MHVNSSKLQIRMENFWAKKYLKSVKKMKTNSLARWRKKQVRISMPRKEDSTKLYFQILMTQIFAKSTSKTKYFVQTNSYNSMILKVSQAKSNLSTPLTFRQQR